MKKLFLSLAISTLVASPVYAEETSGSLIIAGGALSSASMDVYKTFVELINSDDMKIGIVPAATGSINKKYQAISTIFAQYGTKKENVALLPLAVKDDKKTKDVDESLWKDNGQDSELAKQIEQLDAIWFVGGDQTLITKVLLNQDGTDTPVLSAIRSVYQKGGVIGGTSAGAAIMSKTMIAGGNSNGALLNGFKQDYSSMNEQEFGPVVASKGVNFFPKGTIDQHFDRKARLGRLIVTLLEDESQHYGFGVDEETAMVVTGDNISVVGLGGVTLVNTSDANHTVKNYPLTASNIRLSYLQPGDNYDLNTHTYTKRDKSYGTIGHEYFKVPAQSVDGIMSSNRNLDEFVGFNLVDNEATQSISSWTFIENKGVQLIFQQDALTHGYWSQDITKDIYSFDKVRLDIQPVTIEVK